MEGIAFPNDFRRGDYAGDLQSAYADAERWTAEALEAESVSVALAGRMLAKRVMGKAALRAGAGHDPDASSCSCRPTCSAIDYDAFKGWDVGDIVGADGHADAHQDRRAVGAGRRAAPADEVAAPAAGQVARPGRRRAALPQRYVDLIVSPDARDVFVKRSQDHRRACAAGSMRGASSRSKRR